MAAANYCLLLLLLNPVPAAALKGEPACPPMGCPEDCLAKAPGYKAEFASMDSNPEAEACLRREMPSVRTKIREDGFCTEHEGEICTTPGCQASIERAWGGMYDTCLADYPAVNAFMKCSQTHICDGHGDVLAAMPIPQRLLPTAAAAFFGGIVGAAGTLAAMRRYSHTSQQVYTTLEA